MSGKSLISILAVSHWSCSLFSKEDIQVEARKALYGEKKRDKDGNEVEREDVVLPDFSKIMNYINTQVKAPFICVV